MHNAYQEQIFITLSCPCFNKYNVLYNEIAEKFRKNSQSLLIIL